MHREIIVIYQHSSVRYSYQCGYPILLQFGFHLPRQRRFKISYMQSLGSRLIRFYAMIGGYRLRQRCMKGVVSNAAQIHYSQESGTTVNLPELMRRHSSQAMASRFSLLGGPRRLLVEYRLNQTFTSRGKFTYLWFFIVE